MQFALSSFPFKVSASAYGVGGAESQSRVCLGFPVGSSIFAEVLSFLLISMVLIVNKQYYYKQ